MAYLLGLSGLDSVSPFNEAVALLLCLRQIAVLTFARKAYAFVGHSNARQMHQLMRRLNMSASGRNIGR